MKKCFSQSGVLNMRIEFYNDYITNPKEYDLQRSSNGQYTYISELYFDFSCYKRINIYRKS